MLLFLFMLAYSSNIYAQSGDVIWDTGNEPDEPNFMFRSMSVKIKLDGSTMLFEENRDAYLVFRKEGRADKSLKINYDLYTDQLVASLKGELFAIKHSPLASLIVVDGKARNKYIFIEKDKKLKMMEVLVEGTYPLLKTMKINIEGESQSITSTSVGNEIRKIREYYTLVDGKPIRVSTKISKNLRNGDLPDDLKEQLKTVKPKFKKEAAMKAFFSSFSVAN